MALSISVQVLMLQVEKGAGNSFQKTIDSNGYATINGTSGIWSFIASAIGYVTISWSQPINDTCIKDAFCSQEPAEMVR